METPALHSPTVEDVMQAWRSQNAGVPPEQMAFSVRFQVQAIRALAEGQPVSAQRLAADLGMPINQVEAIIGQLGASGVEVDGEGRLLGVVLTLNPTSHRFRVKGGDLYAWCALDTLFLPAYLEETAQVESTCPVTGETIRLTITPTGVTSYSPESTVVSIVDPSKVSCCSTRGPQSAVCSQMHFFRSHEAAETWQTDHSGVVICTVEDAYRIAQISIDMMSALDKIG
ncbi:MAG: alkylmercury lyase MerB [Rhodothermales bacterium]